MSNETPESIRVLQARMMPDGDLNEACAALESQKSPDPRDPASKIHHLCMAVLALGLEGADARLNQTQSQVARFPKEALTQFKEAIGSDERFTGLIEGLEAASDDLKEIMGRRSPNRDIGL